MEYLDRITTVYVTLKYKYCKTTGGPESHGPIGMCREESAKKSGTAVEKMREHVEYMSLIINTK